MVHCNNAGHVIKASPKFYIILTSKYSQMSSENLRHLGQSPPPKLNVPDLCPPVFERTCDNSGSNNSEAALIHSWS